MASASSESLGARSGIRDQGGSRMRSNRLLSPFNVPVLVSTILLVAFGLVVVWSASLTNSDASLLRQAIGVAAGTLVAVGLWRYDYRNLQNFNKALLILVVVLMILPKIPGLGYSAKGMTGWVKFPVIGRFQPSEPAKIFTIMLMAGLAAQYNGKIETLADYLKLCGTLAIPFLLILLQPDLGTGLVVLVSGAAIIACGGAKRSWVIITILVGVGLAAVVIFCSMTEGLPNILKPYQLKRLLVFIDPSIDPGDSGYNLNQAMIAVGSGGMFGKGVGNASQADAGFLPEAHTDFAFALLSEEFGFIGALLLLALYAVLLLSTLNIAHKTDSPYAKLILVGVTAMWGFQIFENIGMNIGIMPITGIPLPFISFGSSSMITQLMAVGLVQSVWLHRPKAG